MLGFQLLLPTTADSFCFYSAVAQRDLCLFTLLVCFFSQCTKQTLHTKLNWFIKNVMVGENLPWEETQNTKSFSKPYIFDLTSLVLIFFVHNIYTKTCLLYFHRAIPHFCGRGVGEDGGGPWCRGQTHPVSDRWTDWSEGVRNVVLQTSTQLDERNGSNILYLPPSELMKESVSLWGGKRESRCRCGQEKTW